MVGIRNFRMSTCIPENRSGSKPNQSQFNQHKKNFKIMVNAPLFLNFGGVYRRSISLSMKNHIDVE